MNLHSEMRVVWILEFSERVSGKIQKRYLHETGSDWGPHELPYPEVDGAMEFLTELAARDHAKHWSGFCDVKPVKVSITTTYKAL